MKMNALIWTVALLLSSAAAAGELPQNCQQLLLVINSNWNAPTGEMYRLEKKDDQWKVVGDKVKVTLGRTGLAWGLGEFESPEKEVHKKEGDGKAPAGLFRLRRMLYGYAENPPKETRWPYTQVTKDWVGVDDVDSIYYNQVFNEKEIKEKDWESHEKMRRKDHLYKWLLVIEHNTSDITPGAGSCIFMHLWRSETSPTAGCTALSEKNFLGLIHWLSPGKRPMILQLPQGVYPQWQKDLSLPDLPKEKREKKE